MGLIVLNDEVAGPFNNNSRGLNQGSDLNLKCQQYIMLMPTNTAVVLETFPFKITAPLAAKRVSITSKCAAFSCSRTFTSLTLSYLFPTWQKVIFSLTWLVKIWCYYYVYKKFLKFYNLNLVIESKLSGFFSNLEMCLSNLFHNQLYIFQRVSLFIWVSHRVSTTLFSYSQR